MGDYGGGKCTVQLSQVIGRFVTAFASSSRIVHEESLLQARLIWKLSRAFYSFMPSHGPFGGGTKRKGRRRTGHFNKQFVFDFQKSRPRRDRRQQLVEMR